MKLYPAHECPQGSAEWHRARAGVITASMVDTVRKKVDGLTDQQAAYVAARKAGQSEEQAMLTANYKSKPRAAAIDIALAGGTPGTWSDAAKNYAFKLAIERITGTALGDDEFNPWQAVRGSKLEEEARMEHEIAADVMVMPVGFVTTDDGKFGASADGWIGDDGGAEYKCFLTTSKLRPILLDNDTSFVFGQCQMNMALCPGRTWWHFGLYLPDLRVIGRHFTLIPVARDDAYIEAMWRDLREFDALVESYKARLIAGQQPVDLPAAPPAQAPEPASGVHVDTLAQARALLDAAASPAPAPPVHVDTSEAPAVKLGDLCDRLSRDVPGGLKMTEAFIRALGVTPVDSKGRAVLIAEAALPDLRDALIARIREVLG